MEANNQVSVEVGGQSFTAQWTRQGHWIRVISDYGSRTVPLSRAHPDALARRTLREIVLEKRGV
jgi:hypothetical protein